MNTSRSPVSKEEKTSNGHHLSESSQSAFRRISAVKTEPTDMTHGKTSKNGTVHSTEALLSNKTSIPNPFLPPLLSSPSDFHSHLALLRPFLSQTLPFVPPLSPSTYWNAFPFLHPYLSNLRPPTFLPPTLSLSSLPSSSPPPPPPPPPPPSSSAPKASTSSNANAKKPSAATHYHQYTITNNNVLVPSPTTLIDFIRRPTNSARETSSTSTNANPTKSKNLKKYKCDICSRAFSRSNTLVTHKRIHTGEKPFVCDICDRAFRQPGNLTRHKLTHTAAKPYACSICSKAFNRASNLHAHQRTHALIMPTMNKATIDNNNNNHGPYTCHHCQEMFEHTFELNLHIAALHHSAERQFAINHREEADVDVDIDDNDDEEDEEEMSSDNSEQDIDLLEN